MSVFDLQVLDDRPAEAVSIPERQPDTGPNDRGDVAHAGAPVGRGILLGPAPSDPEPPAHGPGADDAIAPDDGPVAATGPLRIDVFGVRCATVPPDAARVLAESMPAGADSRYEPLPDTTAALDRRLAEADGERIAIVLDGDPASHRTGTTLLAALGPQRIVLHPAPGPMQAALTRIGLSLDDAESVALDRVGLVGLAARLRRGRLYAIDPGSEAPQRIGAELERGGLHLARIWLVEPGDAAPVHALLGFELSDSRYPFPAGTMIAVFTGGSDGRRREWPGIPAGQIEGALPEAARLLALAWLQPGDDETGWCIEPSAALALDWSRQRPAAELFCIGIEDTALAAAVDLHGAGEGLRAVPSGAFRSLEALPDPDVTFIHAGDGFTQQIRTAWQRLRPGGRMVAAAGDEAARLELMQFAHRQRPDHWQDLAIAMGSAEPWPTLAPARSLRLMGWQKPPRG